jgi:hypothetical protein
MTNARSKAERRRLKRAQRAAGRPAQRDKANLADVAPKSEKAHSTAPTPRQQAHHAYAKPEGQAKNSKPWINETPDLIGVLYKRGRITTAEEQAARHFQKVRAAYLQEIGIAGYRSCLDITKAGHDDSDGDFAVIAADAELRDVLGARVYSFVARETDKPATQRAEDLRRLKIALQKIAGA